MKSQKPIRVAALACFALSSYCQADSPLADNQIAVTFPTTNLPTVSVTVCTQDQKSCETISNIMLDSGSDGLRVFESAFTNQDILKSLSIIKNQAGDTLMTCTQAGGGESFWGYYAKTPIQIGNIHGVNVPVQFMGQSQYPVPSNCIKPVFRAAVRRLKRNHGHRNGAEKPFPSPC
jgi:hypothetical protein